MSPMAMGSPSPRGGAIATMLKKDFLQGPEVRRSVIQFFSFIDLIQSHHMGYYMTSLSFHFHAPQTSLLYVAVSSLGPH